MSGALFLGGSVCVGGCVESLCGGERGAPSHPTPPPPLLSYKPHRYCFEPTPTVTTVRFTDMLWFDAGCAEDKFTVYAAESYAPGLQEALLLNPNCTYDMKPPLSVIKTPVDAVLARVKGYPIPAAAAAVAQARAVERGASAAYVAGYGAVKAPPSLSQDNGKPVNWTEQKDAVGGMLKATLGKK